MITIFDPEYFMQSLHITLWAMSPGLVLGGLWLVVHMAQVILGKVSKHRESEQRLQRWKP